ncbi:hypothetical protein C0J52_00006 [Blattella germanica]|nr:hypothetical protein C0J52_00006 [Blattella germanica]
MGNHHSHDGVRRNSFGRLNSQTDSNDKAPTQLIPIDKLAKILAQKSLEEDSVQGITCRVFTNKVFPRYPDLSQKLFKYLHSCAGNGKHEWISCSAFKQQAENLLGIIADDKQIEIYVRMYAEGKDASQDNFRHLLLQAYRLAMDHYTEGPQICKRLPNILNAVIDSAFHRKPVLSITYLSHWIEQHTPRLIVGIHRYVVHVLSTAYREAENSGSAGLELSTPVLERDIGFPDSSGKDDDVLPVSEVWLLAFGFHLPFPLDSSVQQRAAWPRSKQASHKESMFMHHVFDYRGPTLTFLHGDEGVQFCVAADCEWQESHQYWGREDCAVMQILPHYSFVERGAKLLYLNNSIRGYPKGLRAGFDPRKPIVEVDDGFTVVNYRAIPYPLVSVQVWGCGAQQSRDVQLDMKKWEVKQAERQRIVKLTADDWVDHPDRYLLELAGRPSYSANQPDGNIPQQ